jgi:hypothetical protein
MYALIFLQWSCGLIFENSTTLVIGCVVVPESFCIIGPG